jgi:hypothetical protein
LAGHVLELPSQSIVSLDQVRVLLFDALETSSKLGNGDFATLNRDSFGPDRSTLARRDGLCLNGGTVGKTDENAKCAQSDPAYRLGQKARHPEKAKLSRRFGFPRIADTKASGSVAQAFGEFGRGKRDLRNRAVVRCTTGRMGSQIGVIGRFGFNPSVEEMNSSRLIAWQVL